MADRRRIAAALQYLGAMRDRAAEFGSGVADTLANRARDLGGLAYEAFTSDPNLGRMTTAEFADAAASRAPTPRLDAMGQGAVELGRAVLTQPVETGKAVVRGEVERFRGATESPRAMGQYAGEFVNPLRLAAALRRGPMQELDVYHGTPHRFPATETNPLGELDASKIGTGEGAQAYGHGIYLAESPGVAREYKRVLSDQLASNIRRNQFGAAQAKKYAEKWQAMLDDPSIPRPLRAKDRSPVDDNWLKKQIADEMEEQARLSRWLETKQPGGSLYTLDLPDEMIDRMLDWDKPLSEQPEAIRKALQNHPLEFEPKDSGKFVYETLIAAQRRKAGNYSGRRVEWPHSTPESLALEKSHPVAVSEELRQMGIPGIRYLDAGSRGKDGTGTRNFVVFPGEEKKVKVLRRE